jgi:hypothetical protein
MSLKISKDEFTDIINILRVHPFNRGFKNQYNFSVSDDEDINSFCKKEANNKYIINLSRKDYDSWDRGRIIYHELAHSFRTDFEYYKDNYDNFKVAFPILNLFEDARIENLDLIQRVAFYRSNKLDFKKFEKLTYDSDDKVKEILLFDIRLDFNANLGYIDKLDDSFTDEQKELFKIAVDGVNEIRNLPATRDVHDIALKLLTDMRFKNPKNSSLGRDGEQYAKGMIAPGNGMTLDEMKNAKKIIEEAKKISKDKAKKIQANSDSTSDGTIPEIDDTLTQTMQIWNGSVTYEDMTCKTKINTRYHLSGHLIKQLEQSLKRISMDNTKKYNAMNPSNHINVGNLIKSRLSDGLFINKDPDKGNPFITIICDFSGSMSGSPIINLKRILYGFYRLGLKNMFKGNILVSNSYVKKVYTLPLKGKDLVEIIDLAAAGDEGFDYSLEKIFDSVKKSKKTFFITDGEYPNWDGLHTIKRLAKNRSLIGLYVGDLNKKSGVHRILPILDREIVVDKLDTLFNRLIKEIM